MVNIYPWGMFQIDVFYDGIGGHKDYETTACDSDFTKRSLIQLWFNVTGTLETSSLVRPISRHGKNMLYILQERIVSLKTPVASNLCQIQRSSEHILPARYVALLVL